MMMPSLFQAPPRGFGASASICEVPDARSIRFNLAAVKNASDRLSGDQNGRTALSDPGTGFAVPESSDLIQSCDFPRVEDSNTMVRASGEIETSIVAEDGVAISRRIGVPSSG